MSTIQSNAKSNANRRGVGIMVAKPPEAGCVECLQVDRGS